MEPHVAAPCRFQAFVRECLPAPQHCQALASAGCTHEKALTICLLCRASAFAQTPHVRGLCSAHAQLSLLSFGALPSSEQHQKEMCPIEGLPPQTLLPPSLLAHRQFCYASAAFQPANHLEDVRIHRTKAFVARRTGRSADASAAIPYQAPEARRPCVRAPATQSVGAPVCFLPSDAPLPLFHYPRMLGGMTGRRDQISATQPSAESASGFPSPCFALLGAPPTLHAHARNAPAPALLQGRFEQQRKEIGFVTHHQGRSFASANHLALLRHRP